MTDKEIGALTIAGGSVVSIMGWFIRKLIKDMEDQVSASHQAVKSSQAYLDEKFKEKIQEITKMHEALKVDTSEMSRGIRLIEKNITELSFMYKSMDEKTNLRIEALNKSSDQLGVILQRVIAAEAKINDFGKVIVKK